MASRRLVVAAAGRAVLSDEVVAGCPRGTPTAASRIIARRPGGGGRRGRRVGLPPIMSARLSVAMPSWLSSVFSPCHATFKQGVSCHSIYMVFPVLIYELSVLQ
ncbi:hypothetical protein NL676_022440 [Syzygium grande]|nr:hypothetical protein NL676_022440 [Syzygium grande]